MATTSDLRVGTVIRFNNEIYSITSLEHRTPGNLRAFYQVKMRHLKNNKIIENRFRSGEEVEIVRLDGRTFQYLYRDGDQLVFMDTETYDQIHLSGAFLEGKLGFLKENDQVTILFHEEKPLLIELPPHVILKVTSTPPGYKGDTVNNPNKLATLETGLKINVPIFINEGDSVRVDTRTGEYVERAKV